MVRKRRRGRRRKRALRKAEEQEVAQTAPPVRDGFDAPVERAISSSASDSMGTSVNAMGNVDRSVMRGNVMPRDAKRRNYLEQVDGISSPQKLVARDVEIPRAVGGMECAPEASSASIPGSLN